MNLVFLAWYSCSEPQELSGLCGVNPPQTLCKEIFESLGGVTRGDDEVLFAFAVMAEVAAWCLGDETWWKTTGAECRARLSGRVPAEGTFTGRGEFGKYFEHQTRRQRGT